MKRHTKQHEQLNQSRKIFDQWPSWKKEFLITEYSEKAKNANNKVGAKSAS